MEKKEKYDIFMEYYQQLPYKYKNMILMFMAYLEHDFKRSKNDIDVAATIKKHKGTKTYQELADMSNIPLETLKKSILRKNSKLVGGYSLAQVLGISEYELYYGENEVTFQCRVVTDIKSSFECQTQQLQNALIFLVQQLYLLVNVPEVFEIDLNEDADWR